MKSRALLIVALKKELPTDGLADWTIVYTGVGKVNATITLMIAPSRTGKAACQIPVVLLCRYRMICAACKAETRFFPLKNEC